MTAALGPRAAAWFVAGAWVILGYPFEDRSSPDAGAPLARLHSFAARASRQATTRQTVTCSVGNAVSTIRA
jgi:hypothetical protein